MKHVILLLLIHSSFYFKSYAQADDYVSYFELTIEARTYLDKNDCQMAHKAIDSAFSFVKYPAWRDLKKAIQIGVCLKDSTVINKYCHLIAETYGLLPGLDVFNDSTQYSSIKNEFKEVIETRIERFDKEYIYVLDSLAIEDQKIRGSGPVIYANNINSDSLRTLRLLEVMSHKGFPNQMLVGMKAYGQATLILLHSDFDLHNEMLGTIMLENVMSGNMNPRDYASIIDRRNNYRGEAPLYYETPIGYDNLTEHEKEQITLRRRAIGLRSVEDSMSIQILPNGDIQTTYKY